VYHFVSDLDFVDTRQPYPFGLGVLAVPDLETFYVV